MSVSEQEIHAAAEAAFNVRRQSAMAAGSKDVPTFAEAEESIHAAYLEEAKAAAAILRPDDMTLVGRCRDCRFWDVVGSRTYGLCGDDHGPLHLERTTPDFGCVHFSPVTPRNR